MEPRLPTSFHPAVTAWFTSQFASATDAQTRAWAAANTGDHALIAAPTGSGKTLAAFLAAINDLITTGLDGGLEERCYVLYVSPLKALSNDIQKNLQSPLEGIRAQLLAQGFADVPIRDAVRTGDTPAAERARMRRQPPHILVTTPESLFILLTSDSGRRMLGGVETLIVDEIHALAGNKRGAHLALSIERLRELTGRPFRRVGLSATVEPIATVAGFLRGADPREVQVIDTGHDRPRDLAMVVPDSPLEPVMAGEVWAEVYDKLAQLAQSHTTTLIFVNTRRVAERVARHLGERIGETHVTAHHGSLSRKHRLDAEQRLKSGELRALVATASLELGIDIGDVDLVCQLGSPRRISAFLQRVGRSGHSVGAVPKGRLFPLTLDELVECTALLDAVHRRELDAIAPPAAPLDVLAQQIVAEVACAEQSLDAMLAWVQRAAPYASLPRKRFDQLVAMLAEGYETARGRRGAYLHLDAVNGRVRPRRGAKLTAVTNAGVIPDQFDYDVVLAETGHRVGALGEDFAFESLPGDIFQLGNRSYRVLKVETGRVFVEDAGDDPPNIPFWFGEAPGRSDELSAAVCRLHGEAATALLDSDTPDAVVDGAEAGLAAAWSARLAIPDSAAAQLAEYLARVAAVFGALPDGKTLLVERFFDDAGDTHLVLHSPWGSRINRAWGLALRKRFCRSFNFELQASALEDSIILSLGPTHSFPLLDAAHFLKSASAHGILVQALLDAPIFGTHWRWCASNALAIRRRIGDRRTPPQIQRSQGEDLLATVFPDQLACLENIAGDREIPDHPLVQQTLTDCLDGAMDASGLLSRLQAIEAGELRIIARDLTAPSPMASAIINARPYAFLDDGDAENRRTLAVRDTRLMDADVAAGLSRIDPAVVADVRSEIAVTARDLDELHDALVIHGMLTRAEGAALHPNASSWFEALAADGRATCGALDDGVWVAVERLAMWRSVYPECAIAPDIAPLDSPGAFEAGVTELVRGRLERDSPVDSAAIADALHLDAALVEAALLRLEGEGSAMRGDVYGDGVERWCERRILARLHRKARGHKRQGMAPVSPVTCMQFLFAWQRLRPASDTPGFALDGTRAAIEQLEGFPIPAAAWEDEILPLRVEAFDASALDGLCAGGEFAWARAPGGTGKTPVRSTPLVLAPRRALVHWQGETRRAAVMDDMSPRARRVLESLTAYGASFVDDLLDDTGLLPSELDEALGELVGAGVVTADGFAGLRRLFAARAPGGRRDGVRRRAAPAAGRWSLIRPRRAQDTDDDARVGHVADTLLRRYGIVFRALLARETLPVTWRELFYCLRRREARGEVLGGRFVDGFSGEQFALSGALDALKRLHAAPTSGCFVRVSAVDPLNLLGVVLPGERVPATGRNRILFEDGRAVAVQVGREVRMLEAVDDKREWALRTRLVRGVNADPAPAQVG